MQPSDSHPDNPSASGPSPEDLLAAGLSSNPQPQTSDAAPSPEDLDAEFPKLEIVELLGRGGMGAVYRARQKDLDRDVALKILRPGLETDPGFAERFSREARTLAKLNHPGIVTLYEFGQTSGGRFFILMEYVDGMNLRQLLNAGRLAPREALTIVPPLCDALQYAHDHGVVHRDIKPENILVDRLGRVKIADFGLVRLANASPENSASPNTAEDGLTFMGELMGTPAYMAPEQATQPGQVDHRADLYALGVVFYQMLTGELPAAGELEPPSRRVSLDVRLDAVVLRALERDPERRYHAATEFKTQIESLADQPAAQTTHKRTGWNNLNYRSRASLFGVPLIHVATGVDELTGRKRVARGIVAVGDIAQGVFAMGGLAMGVFAFGGLSIGVVGYGGLVLALLGIGGIAFGLLAAYAGMAIAPVAMGGFAIGWYANGGQAFGKHVYTATQQDAHAVSFFQSFPREAVSWLGLGNVAILVAGFAMMAVFYTWAAARSKGPNASQRENELKAPGPASLPLGLATLFMFLTTIYCGFLMFGAQDLPTEVAVHFNASGVPDSWANRGVAMLVMLVVGLGVPYFLVMLFAMVRLLPNYLISLPHADFWLAPEREAITHRAFVRYGLGIACIVMALFCVVQLLGQYANLREPVHLPMPAMWTVMAGALGMIGVWMFCFWRRFSKPRTEFDTPTAPAKNQPKWLRVLAPWWLVLLITAAVMLPVQTAVLIMLAQQSEAELLLADQGVAVDWSARLDPLIDDTDHVVLDLATGQTMRLDADTVEEADLPPFALIYNRVSDTDGLTGEVIETREFLITKAQDFRLAKLSKEFALETTASLLRKTLIHESITHKAETELGLNYQQVSIEKESWCGYLITANDGQEQVGVLRITPQGESLFIESKKLQ
ncbi:serine/threonine-protein kinase [Cerasicoccus maritimus]|uniref:serine/threonine-protein kinase n=1 Tax=Cerasicoccus maritimus TaxID=490089 RepID=UPI002852AAF9|nr:protein kinase [Cerasicoccus maritimus]